MFVSRRWFFPFTKTEVKWLVESRSCLVVRLWLINIKTLTILTLSAWWRLILKTPYLQIECYVCQPVAFCHDTICFPVTESIRNWKWKFHHEGYPSGCKKNISSQKISKTIMCRLRSDVNVWCHFIPSVFFPIRVRVSTKRYGRWKRIRWRLRERAWHTKDVAICGMCWNGDIFTCLVATVLTQHLDPLGNFVIFYRHVQQFKETPTRFVQIAGGWNRSDWRVWTLHFQ